LKEHWPLPENDALINTLILLCSYLLLFLMPPGEGFGGYLLLAVSAFLFCIGYFRLIAVLPVPQEQRTAMRWEKMAAFLGIAVILLGCLVVYLKKGSVGSIFSGTLLLIEGVVIMGHTFTSQEEESASGNPEERSKHKKQLCILLRIAAVLLAVLAVAVAFAKRRSNGVVPAFTIMIISALLLWVTGYSRSA
jgi:hypothetical protein